MTDNNRSPSVLLPLEISEESVSGSDDGAAQLGLSPGKGREADFSKFKQNHKLLNQAVEAIKPQFKKVLGKHESDFVRAYQVESLSITSLELHGEGGEGAFVLAIEDARDSWQSTG